MEFNADKTKEVIFSAKKQQYGITNPNRQTNKYRRLLRKLDKTASRPPNHALIIARHLLLPTTQLCHSYPPYSNKTLTYYKTLTHVKKPSLTHPYLVTPDRKTSEIYWFVPKLKMPHPAIPEVHTNATCDVTV